MFKPPQMEKVNPSPDVLFSMYALRRAWQQVRRSGESPGSDGIKPVTFEAHLDHELNRIRQQIINGGYRPQPVRRFYIRKSSGKQRPISLWSLRDRVAQRVVHDYLTILLEPLFLECSYGFRPGRTVEQAIHAVANGREMQLKWVLDTDIADCFSSIPLDILMGQVRRIVPSAVVVQLIDLWLHNSVLDTAHEVAGVSQGGVISPLLANLYLHRFDEMTVAALPQARMIRFADDFIILSRTEQEAVWSLEVVRHALATLKLALNVRKTRVVTFDEGFTFLGHTFKGQHVHISTPPESPSGDDG